MSPRERLVAKLDVLTPRERLRAALDAWRTSWGSSIHLGKKANEVLDAAEAVLAEPDEWESTKLAAMEEDLAAMTKERDEWKRECGSAQEKLGLALVKADEVLRLQSQIDYMAQQGINPPVQVVEPNETIERLREENATLLRRVEDLELIQSLARMLVEREDP